MLNYERFFYEPELITAVLDEIGIVNVGLYDKENAYVVPLNFAYKATKDKLYIFMHSGKEGYKLHLMKKHPRVCMTFWKWSNYPDHPYKKRLHDFISVMAFGKIRVLDFEDDPKLCAEAMKAIFKKTMRKGCIYPMGVRAVKIIVAECEWEDVSGKGERPIRTPEDVPMPDVYSLPEDDTPYDYEALKNEKENVIRNKRFLGSLDDMQ